MSRQVTLLCCMFLWSCGGAENNSTETPAELAQANSQVQENILAQETTFQLDWFHSKQGTVFNKNLTGAFDDGPQLSGAISYATRDDVLLDGQLVTPTDLLLILNIEDISVSTITTSYTDSFGNFLRSEAQTGEICNATSPEGLPESVQINDFGSLSPVVCDNGDTQLSTWRALAGSDGTSSNSVDIQVNTTIKNSTGADSSLAALTYSFINGQVENISANFIDVTNGLSYNFQTRD